MNFLHNRNEFKLLLEGRSVRLDLENFRELLKANCSIWCNSDVSSLYRGVSDNENEFLVIDPAQHNREAVGQKDKNVYQSVFDNASDWSSFPKRSKSIIATTSKDNASYYSSNVKSKGKVYEVVPFDNSLIAVCPKRDIWMSFSKNDEDFGLDDFNRGIVSLGAMAQANSVSINTYQDLQDLCKWFDQHLDALQQEFTTYQNQDTGYEEIYKRYVNTPGNLIAFVECKDNLGYANFLSLAKKIGSLAAIEKILEPRSHGFNIVKYDQNFKVDNDREVWTDSKCLLIRNDKVSWVINNLL